VSMPQFMSPEDLPPDVQRQLAEAQQLQVRAVEHEFEHRTRMFRFGALFCDCAPWPHGDPVPAQASCMLHGRFLVGLDGRIL
jgi:hypothetical protein